MRTVVWFVASLIVLVTIFGDSDEDDSRREGRLSVGSSLRETPKAVKEPSAQGPNRTHGDAENDSIDTSTTGSKGGGDTEPSGSSARTYLVTRVIDGDTLELGNGETVRLAGIDAPERGACGSIKATENLQRLTLGRTVRLAPSDEDRDRYGRLLRYVDVGDQDAGLRLIKNGYAIARYDSRDGYGRHPREPRYVAADRASKNYTCPKPATPVPLAGGACAPGYTPCIPPYPPDVDCGDVDGPIYVTGSDPHGLDADDDGVACE